MPLVYELDDDLKPLNRYYLGDPGEGESRHGRRRRSRQEEVESSHGGAEHTCLRSVINTDVEVSQRDARPRGRLSGDLGSMRCLSADCPAKSEMLRPTVRALPDAHTQAGISTALSGSGSRPRFPSPGGTRSGPVTRTCAGSGSGEISEVFSEPVLGASLLLDASPPDLYLLDLVLRV